MKKIVTVLGARPQFIKAAALSRTIKGYSEWTEIVLHTGQHFDKNMSEVFFRELEMSEPQYNLGINSMTHGAMTGHMMIEVEKILLTEKPDVVVVYGDTNSTLAGALVASKLHIPIGHVEAGLRAFDKSIPEEINRVATDHISDVLFAPTDVAVSNLKAEGINDGLICKSGDIMLDTINIFKSKAERSSQLLSQLGVKGSDFFLATIHRQSNTDDKAKLQEIFRVFNEVTKSKPLILPLHPRTQARLKQFSIDPGDVTLIDPVGYLDMVALLSAAELVITDSGGLQKEAFFCGTPCVTVRNTTEWSELVDGGWNTLAPVEQFSAVISDIMREGVTYGKEIAPYGDGNASKLIMQELDKLV